MRFQPKPLTKEPTSNPMGLKNLKLALAHQQDSKKVGHICNQQNIPP